MKLYCHAIAAALLLGLTACASQVTESEAPKGLTLDGASRRIDVRFAAGSSRLFPADAIPAAAAVQRYQGDKVQLPAAAALTNIPATSAAPTGGGATGAGTAGTGP